MDTTTKVEARKPYKPGEVILGLPRAVRRARYRLDKKLDPRVNWEDYRRWDGGRPHILRGYDVLRDLKRQRKEADKAAGRTLATVFGRLKGLTRHRMFRRKAA